MQWRRSTWECLSHLPSRQGRGGVHTSLRPFLVESVQALEHSQREKLTTVIAQDKEHVRNESETSPPLTFVYLGSHCVTLMNKCLPPPSTSLSIFDSSIWHFHTVIISTQNWMVGSPGNMSSCCFLRSTMLVWWCHPITHLWVFVIRHVMFMCVSFLKFYFGFMQDIIIFCRHHYQLAFRVIPIE